MIPFTKLIKQAWSLTKTHKFLWAFGLFLFFGQLVILMQFVPTSSSNSEALDLPTWSVFIAAGVLVLIILLFLFYFRAKVASIIAVKAVVDKQATSFTTALGASYKYYWRVLGVSAILYFLLFVVFGIIGSPILYLWGEKFTARALILTVFGIGIFVSAFVFTQLVSTISSMFVSLYDMTISEAIRSSFDMLEKYLKRLVLVYINLMLIMFASLLLSLFMAGLIAAPFVFFSIFAYHRGGFGWSLGLTIVGSILGSVVFLTLISTLCAFIQTTWVLVFLDLNRPQKFEEEVVPVPEAV